MQHQLRAQAPPLKPLIDAEARHHERRHRHPVQVEAPCPQRPHRPSSLHLERTQPVATHHPTAVTGDLDDHTLLPVRHDRVSCRSQPSTAESPQSKTDRSCRPGSIRSTRTASTTPQSSSPPALPDPTLLPARPTPMTRGEASDGLHSPGSPWCCTSPTRRTRSSDRPLLPRVSRCRRYPCQPHVASLVQRRLGGEARLNAPSGLSLSADTDVWFADGRTVDDYLALFRRNNGVRREARVPEGTEAGEPAHVALAVRVLHPSRRMAYAVLALLARSAVVGRRHRRCLNRSARRQPRPRRRMLTGKRSGQGLPAIPRFGAPTGAIIPPPLARYSCGARPSARRAAVTWSP